MNNIACFIPARYESRRFAGKALACIDGKPMIQHVHERAQKAAGLSCLAVVTDDLRIHDVVAGFGGLVVMTPAGLPTGTDRIAAALEILGIIDDDMIIVNVQGDQPCITAGHINQVAGVLMDCGEPFAMATLAYQLRGDADIHDPNTVKVVFDSRFQALYFSRSHIPHRSSPAGACYKHLGIYAYRRPFLKTFAALPQGRLEQAENLEQLRAIENGHGIRIAVTEIDSPSVDIPGDIPTAATFMQNHGGCAG